MTTAIRISSTRLVILIGLNMHSTYNAIMSKCTENFMIIFENGSD